MDHAVVQKWLRSVLGPYTDRDRVFADIDRTLIAVSSLSPKTEVFTFNDGRTQLLLNLDGTIPVNFRGNTYNIPVAYWIPRDYPREPPMAFVAPTPDMAIRKGPNVDPSGEIGGEYLRRWRNKPEACNLLDLVHDCQQMFGREPPPPYQPQHGPSSTQSPLAPGPHPYQHAINSAAGANGHSNSPTPAIVPKPKGFNLLDEEDDSSVHPHTSSAGPAPGNPSVAPPPRPINPELLALHDRLYHKIDSRLTTLSSTLSASNARLDVLSADLDRGLPAIEDELSRLKAVRDVCATTGDRLQTSVTELTDQVRSLQSREDPDPDTMVLATSIVGNQLVDLVAEDNAIEDTLYHLGRALNAERIDLEKFLKQTRVLAREQFMKRALAMKIGEGMGWA
uniref:Uncharacterized protein n=1 Tax=Kalmanozyma brasiliensis (strain GHG001) TaxID=1365824 RepID=V5E4L8_KALBG